MAELLQWDVEGEKYFHGGVSKTVLFVKNTGVYGKGIAWSGVTGIDESPEGGDTNEIFADNVTYAKLRGRDQFNFSINAYQYPDEFEECDGSAIVTPGLVIGQQNRKEFGICYRTEIGSDDLGSFTKGYELHFVYGCTTTPVQKSHETLNDSPDAETFSWDCESTAVKISPSYGNFNPVAHIKVSSLTTPKAVMDELEAKVYGTANGGINVDAELPLPDDILEIFNVNGASAPPSEPVVEDPVEDPNVDG